MTYYLYAHLHSIFYIYSIIYGYTYISFYTCIQSLGTILPVAICLRERRMTFPPPQPPALNYFSKVKMFVPIKDFHSAKVAERVAMLMMQKIKSGSSEASPMLVELLDESRRSIRDGTKYKTTVAASFLWLWIMSSYPFVACYSLLSFSLVQIFCLFQGQKEPCRSCKHRKGYVFATISYQVILFYIM